MSHFFCRVNARKAHSTPAGSGGEGVADMFKLAMQLMDKDKGDKNDVELRTALLKAQVDGAEGQAKIINLQAKVAEVGARADFLTKMLQSGVLSEEQSIKIRDELFSLSGL